MREVKMGKLLGSKGFSLVEAMVALGILAVGMVAATSSMSFLSEKTQSLVTTVDNDGSMGEAYRLLLSPESLRDLLGVEKSPALAACARGEGQNCSAYQRRVLNVDMKSVSLAQFIGTQRTCDQLSLVCPVERSMSYQWKCSSPNSCEGIKFFVELTEKASADPKTGKVKNLEKPKTLAKNEFEVSSSILFGFVTSKFKGCANGFPIGINLQTNTAICDNRTGKIDCGDKPLVGLGPGKCGEPEVGSATSICSMTLQRTNGNNLQLSYQLASNDFDRFEYSCSGSLRREYIPLSIFQASKGVQGSQSNVGNGSSSTGTSQTQRCTSGSLLVGCSSGSKTSGSARSPASSGSSSSASFNSQTSVGLADQAVSCTGRVISKKFKTSGVCMASYTPPPPPPPPSTYSSGSGGTTKKSTTGTTTTKGTGTAEQEVASGGGSGSDTGTTAAQAPVTTSTVSAAVKGSGGGFSTPVLLSGGGF